MDSNGIWVRRGSKVHGPFTDEQVKAGIKSGKVLPTDELARSDAGPWKSVADSVRPSSTQANASSTLASPLAAKATPSNSGPPTPRASQSGPPVSSQQLVHQLDTTHFLIEGMPHQQVFETLKQAAARSHTVTGAFLKSGLIRGTGDSGIEFVVKVEKTDEGVSFLIDGSTPDGPANFGVLFNPMSVEGWATAGVVGLFNSFVNNSAARTVADDVSLLIVNLLDSLGAAELVTGNKSGTVDAGALGQQLKALPHVVLTPIEHNRLVTNFPNESLVPTIYQLLKAQEATNTQSVASKLGLQLGTRYDLVQNVALTEGGGGVTANIPDGKGTIYTWTLVADVRAVGSGRSEVSVNVKCNAPAVLDPLGYVKKRCIKQAEFIRDAIATDLKMKMEGG